VRTEEGLSIESNCSKRGSKKTMILSIAAESNETCEGRVGVIPEMIVLIVVVDKVNMWQ
jgi:hypothetical protein